MEIPAIVRAHLPNSATLTGFAVFAPNVRRFVVNWRYRIDLAAHGACAAGFSGNGCDCFGHLKLYAAAKYAPFVLQ
jgi:hypothetical protein